MFKICVQMKGVCIWSKVGELKFHMQKNRIHKQKKYCNKFNKDFKNGLYNFSKLYLTYDIHIWYILQWFMCTYTLEYILNDIQSSTAYSNLQLKTTQTLQILVWINQLQYVQTMKYYITLKVNVHLKI